MILFNNVPVKFGTFPNGETMFPDNENIVSARASSSTQMVTLKYETDADLMHLWMFKKHLDDLHVKADLTIHYMPYSRQDRAKDDSAFTLRHVTDFINELDFKYVAVVEPHSDVTCALLRNSYPVWVVNAILPKVLEYVNFNPVFDRIVFPDAGAQKRYETEHLSLIGFKVRDFDTGKIKSLDLVGAIPPADHAGTAVIVDDLCSFGGTFKMCNERLRQMGFQKVHLVVAHLEVNVHEGTLLDHIDNLYATDSIYPESAPPSNNPPHIFILEDLL